MGILQDVAISTCGTAEHLPAAPRQKVLAALPSAGHLQSPSARIPAGAEPQPEQDSNSKFPEFA